jgi:hypothetical protein
MGRTNIAVEQSLADDLSLEAGKQNKTLYAFANESLLAVLDVVRSGGMTKQIAPAWRFVNMMKDMECVGLPEDLIEKITSKVYERDPDWLAKVWYDEGTRLGSYLKMVALEPEELMKMIDDYRVLIPLLPIRKIEFRKTGSEDSGHEKYVVRAVGVGHSKEITSCAEQFIRGVLSSYSLKVTDAMISEGMIEISAEANHAK